MKHVRPVVWIVLAVLIAFLVSGCGNGKLEEPNPIPIEKTEPDQGRDVKPEKNAVKQDNDLEISSSNNEKEDKAKKEQSHDLAYPALMGVQIGDSKPSVIALHGESMHSFVMEDPLDPIVVYNYGLFMIGFDQMEQVKFVEITSPEANPGLGGLKLGSNIHMASSVLGEPDSKTDHVWNYISEHTVLKFDIDPNTHHIISIKLFSTE